MSKEHPDTREHLDIALERISADKAARAGRLDLGNLGPDRRNPSLVPPYAGCIYEI